MKRDKTKKTVLTKSSKPGRSHRPVPAKPTAFAKTESGRLSGGAACLSERQTATTSPTGSEPLHAEEAVPSFLQDSSDAPVEETASTGKTFQRLVFLLSNEEYGIDISMVREIIRLPEITPIPRAPSYIRGIMSLRGAVLPILDLCWLLSMPDSKPDRKSRILVASFEEAPVGIIVDAVTEVVEHKEEDLEPPPMLTSNGASDHIVGMVRYKGRLIILLDLERVYAARHRRIQSVQG
jgi:purine-binding chemotaxis protein CheW